MPNNPASFRFPFASLGKLPPEVRAAHLATFNALTDIYQAIAQQKQNSTSSTTILNETVLGTSGNSGNTVTGVSSFNGSTGDITYFPSLALVNNQVGQTAYTTQTGDNGGLILVSNASPVTVTMNYAVAAPWFTTITNAGTGIVTVNTTSGLVNGLASITIPGGSFATIFFDGTNWWADAPGATAGGVTQLLAGTNVSLSPPGGTGVVTINATPGAISRAPHDVTGIRTFGGIYQNLSGNEMLVTGWGMTTGGLTSELTALIDTVTPPITPLWGNEYTASVAGGKAGFNFTVPNNYYYEVVLTGSGAITSLGKWVEYY